MRDDEKIKCLPQTVHTIEKVFIPTDLPFVTRRRARKLLDIALIKLGKLCRRFEVYPPDCHRGSHLEGKLQTSCAKNFTCARKKVSKGSSLLVLNLVNCDYVKRET